MSASQVADGPTTFEQLDVRRDGFLSWEVVSDWATFGVRKDFEGAEVMCTPIVAPLFLPLEAPCPSDLVLLCVWGATVRGKKD